MAPRLRRLALVLVAVATIGGDEATKHLARTHLAGAPRQSYRDDMIRLEYIENAGAFLGGEADGRGARV